MSNPPNDKIHQALQIFQRHINNYLYDLKKEGHENYVLEVQSECTLAVDLVNEALQEAPPPSKRQKAAG